MSVRRSSRLFALVVILLCGGCGDPTPEVISEAEHTLLGPNRQVHSVSFSHDGRLVVCSGRGIRVWRPGTGFDGISHLGDRKPVYSVSCSVGGSLMASAGGDGVATLWDLRTAAEGFCLSGHRGWIHDLSLIHI